MIKRLFITYRPENSFFSELALTFLRVFTGLSLALAHGMGKTPPSEPFIEGVTNLGFPMPVFFAWAASLSELAGGIALAIGLFTRPASALICFTMAVAAFGRHANDAYGVKEMAFLYGAITFFFMVRGSNKFSIDSLMK